MKKTAKSIILAVLTVFLCYSMTTNAFAFSINEEGEGGVYTPGLSMGSSCMCPAVPYYNCLCYM